MNAEENQIVGEGTVMNQLLGFFSRCLFFSLSFSPSKCVCFQLFSKTVGIEKF